jgi:HPt (histidine-containing phosphotransfer) domain-containing protein
VHALKSASASIGALGLSKKAALLEEAGRQGDMKTIGELLRGFHADLEALVRGIRAVRELEESTAQAEGAAEDQEISEMDREELKRLREALENQEMQDIDTLVNQLKEKKNPQLRKAVAALVEQVLLFEFDRAIALIDDLLVKAVSR